MRNAFNFFIFCLFFVRFRLIIGFICIFVYIYFMSTNVCITLDDESVAILKAQPRGFNFSGWVREQMKQLEDEYVSK